MQFLSSASPAERLRRPLRVHPATAALLLAALIAAAYHHTLHVPFLMDDLPSIVENPTIRRLASSWFPPRGSGLTVSGRPILNVSLALNYRLSGLHPWSYHLLNLTIHWCAACLLFGIIRRTFLLPRLAAKYSAAGSAIALAVSLLWALHPLQTESITYVVQRAESLVGLFYLGTFYCFIRALGLPAAKGWIALTLCCCLAGMGTKEVMATAPVLLLLYDRTFAAGSWREVWNLRGRFHASLAATWLVLGMLILASGSRGGTVGFDSPIPTGQYALTQTYAIFTYLRLAFWPVGLVFDYGVPQAVSLSEIAPEFCGFIVILIATLILTWRAPAAGYCALFFLGVLAPTSSVVPVVTQTMTEHRMYLPLAGVVALAVAGAYRMAGPRALWGCALVTPGLLFLTYDRNSLYLSDLALWEDTAEKRPDNLRAHLNIGMIHYREGRFDEAAAAYRRVLALDPNMVEAANNLGNSLLKLGQVEAAAGHLSHALESLEGRERAIALTNLGNVLLAAGQEGAALERLNEAVRLAPDLADAQYNLASAFVRTGDALASLPHFAVALRLRPDDHEILGNYASTLLELDRTDDAIRALHEVIRLRPDSAEAHNNLGVALAMAGRTAEARTQFSRAVELAPDFAPARENLQRADRALAAPR